MLKPELELKASPAFQTPKIGVIQQEVRRLIRRFPHLLDNAMEQEMHRLLALCEQEFLNRRTPRHLVRMISAQCFIRKNLFRLLEDGDGRYVEVRFLPSTLSFPFSSKPVLGLMIGVNLHGKYELFTEEHLIRAVQKLDPLAQLVKGVSYHYQEPQEKVKIVYIELERPISNKLQRALLKEEIKQSVEKVSPSVFMSHNEEDILKNILTLSQEIKDISDLPQVMIYLEKQTSAEIIFKAVLLYVSRNHSSLLKELFQGQKEVVYRLDRLKTVRYLRKKYPIQASVFRLYISKTAALLRTDASINFYLARKKICDILRETIGEFRDYNGSIIFQQQETFAQFKQLFNDHPLNLLENFFYSLSPLEIQATISLETLKNLFSLILESLKHSFSTRGDYFLRSTHVGAKTFAVFRSKENAFQDFLSQTLIQDTISPDDLVFTQFSVQDSIVSGFIFENLEAANHKQFVHALKTAAKQWAEKTQNLQILRLSVSSTPLSLDPRIGGDENSKVLLKLLFEGLMRIDQNGQVIPGVAEKVEVSPNGLVYTFTLRKSTWSNGDAVIASDFEYAWKTALSPYFKTPFAYFFYPIKNAKAVKEGKLPAEKLGVETIDPITLRVELDYPVPYFLELLAHTQFSPINASVDHISPNWPSQVEEAYVCNGPFFLKKNHPAYGYQLIKNSSYWDSANIQLDRIKIIKANEVSAVQMFQKNELDWVGYPMRLSHNSLANLLSDTMVFLPNEQVYWYVFNTRIFPFSNCKLRQALALAFNRAEILRNMSGILWPAFTPLPIAHSRSTCMEENKEKAVRIFEEALKELKLTRETFPPIQLICTQGADREKMTECMAKNWETLLGIRYSVESLDWSDLLPRTHEGDFHVALTHWMALIDDPSYTLGIFRDAHESINFPKWENEAYQSFFDQGQNERDFQKRLLYFAQAEEILIQEAPLIPVLRTLHSAIRKDHLSLTTHASLKSWDFKWASLNKERYL